MNMGMAALEYAEKMLRTSEQNAAKCCPYCAGKGGRHRTVASRFAGCESVAHEGPWETCWSCGSGVSNQDSSQS